jgi:hypothetical protein
MVLLSEIVQTFILADFWWVGEREQSRAGVQQGGPTFQPEHLRRCAV